MMMKHHTRYFLCSKGPLFDRCKDFFKALTDANDTAVAWARDKGFNEPLYSRFGSHGYVATGIACGKKNDLTDEVKSQMTQPRRAKGSYRMVYNPKKNTKLGKEFSDLPKVPDFEEFAKDLIDPPAQIDWSDGSASIRLFGNGLGIAYFNGNDGPFLIYLPDHELHWEHIQIEHSARNPLDGTYNWMPDPNLKLEPIKICEWDLLVAKDKVLQAEKAKAS